MSLLIYTIGALLAFWIAYKVIGDLILEPESWLIMGVAALLSWLIVFLSAIAAIAIGIGMVAESPRARKIIEEVKSCCWNK